MPNGNGKDGNGFSEGILSLLGAHVYGLTIEDVSKLLAISRITTAKYLAVLEALGKVSVREVGKAKLHYLPKHYKEERA